MAVTDELSAPSDTVIRFRLKTPFALLPEALATPTSMCCIVPERLAQTDPNQQMPQVIGSGPFRFVGQRAGLGPPAWSIPSSPTTSPGRTPTNFTSGGKPVYFDRVEWNVVPDPATAAGAMASGEFDWWENPNLDLVPSMQRNKALTLTVKDHAGEIGCLRFNHLYPPFDNPAIRRIAVSAINQEDLHGGSGRVGAGIDHDGDRPVRTGQSPTPAMSASAR